MNLEVQHSDAPHKDQPFGTKTTTEPEQDIRELLINAGSVGIVSSVTDVRVGEKLYLATFSNTFVQFHH